MTDLQIVLISVTCAIVLAGYLLLCDRLRA